MLSSQRWEVAAQEPLLRGVIQAAPHPGQLFHGVDHAAPSDGNAAIRAAGYGLLAGSCRSLRRLKVIGRHWRPVAQQATSLAFEIPMAVSAHIADPAMAVNVAPHPFAGTADAPGAAYA